RLEIARTGQGGADARRAEIVSQVLADAQRRASGGMGMDIAEGEARMRRDVGAQAEDAELGEPAPFAFVDQHQTRLVVELMVPALGIGRADLGVPIALDELGTRRRSYDTAMKLDRVQPVATVGGERNAAEQPTGI